MTRIALAVAACALAGMLANTWSMRNTESRLMTAMAEVEARPEHQSELEVLTAVWKSGDGVPTPVTPPASLPSVSRLEWTRSAVEAWGMSSEACSGNHGEWNQETCLWKIASNPAVRNDGHRDAPPPEDAERILRHRMEQVGGELSFEDRPESKGRFVWKVRLDLTVPDLEGLGELLSGLSRLPFVLFRLDWDESGATTITGALVGG